MFKIRDEYGQRVAGALFEYDTACRVTWFLRSYGVDFFVVDVKGGRAVSEVFEEDSLKDLAAAIIASTLWRKHRELV